MLLIISFFIGLLFSLGLTISGLINPSKVIGFLDIFGNWQPDLVFVMGGAVLTNIILFRFVLKRKNPLLATNFSIPNKSNIDLKLVLGSSLFGIGWGIVGICPGPGLVNITSGGESILIFIVSLLSGMFIFQLVQRKLLK